MFKSIVKVSRREARYPFVRLWVFERKFEQPYSEGSCFGEREPSIFYFLADSRSAQNNPASLGGPQVQANFRHYRRHPSGLIVARGTLLAVFRGAAFRDTWRNLPQLDGNFQFLFPQAAADLTDRLSEPILVLDQSHSQIALATRAEAATGTDRHVPFIE